MAPLEARLAKTGFDGFFTQLTHARTWYFIDSPNGFETIPRERLGVGFTRDPVIQYAIQTEREVWVDLRKFNAEIVPGERETEMTRLYLHELSMTAYMLRFLDSKQICREFQIEGAHCQPDKPTVGEPTRTLNEKDYVRIRAMTNWLFNHLGDANETSLGQALRHFEFGPGFDAAYPRAQRAAMSADAIAAALTSAQALGRVPQQCGNADVGNLSERCKIEFEYEPGQKNGVTYSKTPVLTIKITRARSDGPSSIQSLKFSIFPDVSVDVGGPLFKTFSDVTDARELNLFEVAGSSIHPVGEITHSVQIGFRTDEDAISGGVRVVGLLLTALRVYRSERRADEPQTYDAWFGMPDNPDRLLVFGSAVTPAIPLTSATGGAMSSIHSPE